MSTDTPHTAPHGDPSSGLHVMYTDDLFECLGMPALRIPDQIYPTVIGFRGGTMRFTAAEKSRGIDGTRLRQVAALAICGATNHEAAQVLGLSPETIKTYRERVAWHTNLGLAAIEPPRKVGARTGILQAFTELNWLEHEDPMKPLPHMSSREKEVLDMVPSGLTNMQIANSLFIGESTVQTHRENIGRILGSGRGCALAAASVFAQNTRYATV